MNAESQRAYRDRLRGGPPRELAPCGTYAAWMRHRRHGEEPCESCREAYNAHQRKMYAERRRLESGYYDE
jgi:hypothetical protein